MVFSDGRCWTRRAILHLSVGALGGLAALSASCAAPSASSPSSAPAPAPTAPAPAPTLVPAPTAAPAVQSQSAAASPAPATSASGAWANVVANAKKEGTVVILGGQGADLVQALTQPFTALYPEISVDYTSLAGDELPAKLLPEVASGHPLSDLVINGTTPTIPVLVPAGAVQPIPPFLVGPTSSDASAWQNGQWTWADNAQQDSLVFSLYVKAPFVYNSDQASASDFSSWKDLLDPRWKGKITLHNPAGAGGGQGQATFWYANAALGQDFLTQFFQQDVALSDDDQQMLDSVAHGDYAIGIGISDLLINQFMRQGLPLQQLPPEALAEGTYVTAGNGALAVVAKLPHPNALQVYLDWFLSRDGQYSWSKAAGFASLRQDVPRDHVPDLFIPQPGESYALTYQESYIPYRDQMVAFIKPYLS